MNILTKLITCACLAALIISCSTVKFVDTSVLTIGMTKAQVQQALKKKPFGTISAKKYPETNTIIEVVEYNQYYGGEKLNRYWLYFVNDKLDRWEPASDLYPPGI